MIIDNNICFIVENNKGLSKVVYLDCSKNYNQALSKNLIEKSCIYYGSTLSGRVKAAKEIIKTNYKIPIIINEDMICFSIKQKNEIIFLFFHNIKDYKKENNQVRIKFKNNKELKINIKFAIFQRHIYKCAYLYSYFKKIKDV